MKVGFIGAGKVGFSLGKYLADNNQKVIGFTVNLQKMQKKHRSLLIRHVIRMLNVSKG